MTGRLIFLTMTALPESDAATSFDLKALFSKSRLIESATAVPSMIAPSTMLSGGIGSMAKATTLKLLPTGLSSTALTALDPMSRPTTAFDFPKPNTVMSLKQVRHPQSRYQPQLAGSLPIPCDASRLADVFVSESQNRQVHRSAISAVFLIGSTERGHHLRERSHQRKSRSA